MLKVLRNRTQLFNPSSIAVHSLLIVIVAIWLAKVTSLLPEPYLVSRPLYEFVVRIHSNTRYRMKSSMFVKPKPIGITNGMCGTQRSPLLQACESPHVKDFASILADLERDTWFPTSFFLFLNFGRRCRMMLKRYACLTPYSSVWWSRIRFADSSSCVGISLLPTLTPS